MGLLLSTSTVLGWCSLPGSVTSVRECPFLVTRGRAPGWHGCSKIPSSNLTQRQIPSIINKPTLWFPSAPVLLSCSWCYSILQDYFQSCQPLSHVVRWVLSKGECKVLHQSQEPLGFVNLVVVPQARQLQAMTEALLQLRMRMTFQHVLAGLWAFSFHPETPPTLSTSLTLIFQAVTTGYDNTLAIPSTWYKIACITMHGVLLGWSMG